MAQSIVFSVAVFLVMTTCALADSYCYGKKPTIGYWSDLAGRCYVQFTLTKDGQPSSAKCAAINVVPGPDKVSGTTNITFKVNGKPVTVINDWVQVDGNLQKVKAGQSPAPALMTKATNKSNGTVNINAIIAKRQKSFFLIGCSLNGDTVSDVEVAVICTTDKNPKSSIMFALKSVAKHWGYNTNNMVKVDHSNC